MTFSIDGKGAWGLPAISQEESFKLLDRYKEVNGNFLDTADNYGTSEQVVGNWLSKEIRDNFVVATKVRQMTGPTVNEIGLSRKHILANVERSLTNLRTNYIDLYQCHSFDHGTPLKETLSALNDLVRIGKVHYIGISNFNGAQLQKAIDMCNYIGLEPIVSLQPQYSLLCRSTEWELIPVCLEEGLAVLPWSPLVGGWLAGKYKREGPEKTPSGPEEGSRINWAQKVGWKATSWDYLNNDHTWNVLDVVSDVASKREKTMAQVSLRWLMQKPGVTAPLIGSRSLESLNENLGAAGWSLTSEEMERLDQVSAIHAPYPHNIGNEREH